MKAEKLGIQEKKQNLTLFDRHAWLLDAILVAILMLAIVLRFIGLNWDQSAHLHPDERFLTMVTSGLSSVRTLAEYFNTSTSSLNPQNVGYGFFVYGTFPIFIVRYLGEVFQKTGYDQIFLVGRQLSALVDVITVFMVYLIGKRLYGKPVGLIAAAFAAFSVVPIQQAHFFTVDTFANLFGFIAVYQVVILATPRKGDPGWQDDRGSGAGDATFREKLGTLLPYLYFGLALGMAAASKINAGALAFLLPLSVLIRYGISLEKWTTTRLVRIMIFLALAGIAFLLTFRVLQPYAFEGPGFFNLGLNPKWIANLQELKVQSSGLADFPPALQWANRPLWFAWKNTIVWGMGLPFGLTALAGFLWMGWRILRGEWHEHLILWIWTGFYSAWQGLSWVRAMRYQMLIYPSAAILAAWFLGVFWRAARGGTLPRFNWRKIIAVSLAVISLGGTLAWALAFTSIYTRPVTRLAASDWILQNIPGPINLHITTNGGEINEPLAYRAGALLEAGKEYRIAFSPQSSGSLVQVTVPHLAANPGGMDALTVEMVITPLDGTAYPIGRAAVTDNFGVSQDLRGSAATFQFATPANLSKEVQYLLLFSVTSGSAGVTLTGPISLDILTDGETLHQVLPVIVQQVKPGEPYSMGFSTIRESSLDWISLPHVVDQTGSLNEKTLRLIISPGTEPCVDGLTSADFRGTFESGNDPRGGEVVFKLDHPLALQPGLIYTLQLCLVDGEGSLAVYGSAPANESTWDDALPYPVDGINAYSGDQYSGIYRGDLNFELYWDDNATKLDLFETTLDQADTIFISSNRQWGTTTRIPERYPLTITYYRNLLGCPEGRDLVWCYNVAEPGMFSGTLGFELVKTFTSYPSIGGLQFNDQFAEEAFSVYDHPKVLIFRKTSAYDPVKVREILSAVDLSNVIHLVPKDAGRIISTKTLMLPPERLEEQQAGGTWSELFSRDSLINRSPLVGILAWYLAVSLLGWLCYPIVRLAFPGSHDRGYPLSRTAGLLLLAFSTWLIASVGGAYSKLTIGIVLFAIGLTGIVLGIVQRRSLVQEIRSRWKYYLSIELLALVFFMIFLVVRLGNPDLWHPAKGGEKPMDFSYFNAILKSTTFPPYDPWLAGGYINYYYYGFVIVGTLVKWLGLIPSFAYNLILPTLFSLLGLGAFSAAWNLTAASWVNDENKRSINGWMSGLAGLSAALSTAILGNLGTVRMVWHGLQKLAAPGGNILNASFFQRIAWTFSGLAAYFKMPTLPYYPGDWYWIPSRAIGDGPITEFPAFTFLYADLHAHLIALPVTLFALGWVISIALSASRWGEKDGRYFWLSLIASFMVGAVAIGSLRPTNTWDYPTYLVLAVVAILFTTIRYGLPHRWSDKERSNTGMRLLIAILFSVLLVVAAQVFYQPFSEWYARLVGSGLWQGEKTPFWSYLTHWGLFLFVIVFWLGWETYHWMATTPLKVVARWRRYKGLIWLIAAIVLSLLVILTFYFKLEVGWLILLLGLWIIFLLLAADLPDAKRVVLFLVGSALALTLAVELIVLRDDIGRMNTVFKFYLQAWTLLAVSSGAMFIWIFKEIRSWSPNWRIIWQAGMILLVGSAALFPLTASRDKMTDRMAPQTPLSLDGMAYMQYAYYDDMGLVMDLKSDYEAILWMQDHVQGSPVIVEGNTPEYRWGSRFTIYTGLPGVVGWNWHQRQQRAVQPETVVTDRIKDIAEFYTTNSMAITRGFLERYNVSYIIVGQLEHAYYPGDGLEKFSLWDGVLWKQVYTNGLTTIYEVIRP